MVVNWLLIILSCFILVAIIMNSVTIGIAVYKDVCDIVKHKNYINLADSFFFVFFLLILLTGIYVVISLIWYIYQNGIY